MSLAAVAAATAAHDHPGRSTGDDETAACWTVEGDQDEAHLGLAVAPAGDVNGDGYADVVVGAPFYDGGQRDEGRVFVFYGGADGLRKPAGWSAESDREQAHLGWSVAGGGDVNGDGFDDIVVGVPHLDCGGGGEGGAWVFLGGSSGLAPSPAWTMAGVQAEGVFGAAVTSAGDVNGDGYDDVLVGAPGEGAADHGRAYLFLGSASGLGRQAAWRFTGERPHAHCGHSVASAGDVDGDGRVDVVVGAPYCSRSGRRAGVALVFRGAAGGLDEAPAWYCEGGQNAAMFGVSVAGAGDVNGDGYDDIVVGCSAYAGDEPAAGRSFVFLGGRNGPGEAHGGSGAGDEPLGWSAAGAGDVNGDGYDDVIVGLRDASASFAGGGRACIFHGSARGLAVRPAWSTDGEHEDGRLGWAVAAAGDVNRDGYADIVVGAPFAAGHGSGSGRACVYYGAPGSMSGAAPWSYGGGQEGAELGAALHAGGDLDGDGYADLVVGAPGASGGAVEQGRVLVFRGSEDGLAREAAWRVDGTEAGARLGTAVAIGGDFNRDGYADLVAGAPGAGAGPASGRPAPGGGRVLVFLGSSSGVPGDPSWSHAGEQAAGALGTAVATADFDGDGYDDLAVGSPGSDGSVAQEGMVLVFAGEPAGLAELPAWGAYGSVPGGRFGQALSAGDVNGDGWADLAVGAPGAGTARADESRTVVFLGSPSGLGGAPAWIADGGDRRVAVGVSVAVADVDGDGFAEVVAGVAGAAAGTAALAFPGSPAGPAAASWDAPRQDGNTAESIVGVAGDLDGDGYLEVGVGSAVRDGGRGGIGRLSLFRGRRPGLSGSPAWVIEGAQPGDAFGSALAGGDLDGDGRAELVVGAPGFSGRRPREGRVYVFHGSPDGPLLPARARLEGAPAAPEPAAAGIAAPQGDRPGRP